MTTTVSNPSAVNTPMPPLDPPDILELWDSGKTSLATWKLRQYLELDQTTFARQIGCAQSAISNWESGTRKPRGLYARAVRNLIVAAIRRPASPPAA